MVSGQQIEESFVDVFDKDVFGGKLTRLRPGDEINRSNIGSLIIGPRASLRLIDSRAKKSTELRPSQVVANFRQQFGNSRRIHLSVARVE
jgi:hypothetical protein